MAPTKMTSSTKLTPDDGWTIVTRRHRPPHFLPSPYSPPKQIVALSPNALTYSQILQSKPTTPTVTTYTRSTNQTLVPTGTSAQGSDTQPMYVQSPHSPTLLPYPPSPHLKEWWGRCFRCARKGHIVAECKYPRFNPNTPKNDHCIANCSNAALNPTAKPYSPVAPPKAPTLKRPRAEPTFEEFFAEPEPQQDPQMPLNRPKRAYCYFNRDDHYFCTLEKMLRGIVIQPPHRQIGQLTLDQAAATVCASNKVSPTQLLVARLTCDKYLVLLPPMMDREEVIAAIPNNLWDDSFKLHSYSPLTDTFISIPFFKLWIDVIGVPLGLQNETHMARAVSSFWLYLNS